MKQCIYLSKQMLCGMIDMIISKRSDGEVAVVVIGLVPDQQVLVVAGFFGRGGEVLGQELAGVVEVVGCALEVEFRPLEWVLCLG